MKMTTFFSILQTCGSGAWCNNNNWGKTNGITQAYRCFISDFKKRKIFGKTSRAKSAIPFVWIYMLVGGIKASTQSIVNHRGNAPIWSSLLESAMA